LGGRFGDRVVRVGRGGGGGSPGLRDPARPGSGGRGWPGPRGRGRL